MEERLRVNDFYKPLEITCAIEIENLDRAFFVQEKLFVTTKDALVVLQQFSLKTKLKEKSYLLPLEKLSGVNLINNVICVFFQGNQDLWICSNDKIVPLKSHFLPITAMVTHDGNLITGSVDMTIRVWNSLDSSLIQDPKLHALSGHTGAITCFLSLDKHLISSSSDKSIIVWNGTKIYAKKEFPSQVRKMIECSESQQLAIYEQNRTISILSSRILAKERKIEVIRTIDKVLGIPLIGLHEIDDSFLEIVYVDKISIAEINLGTVMAEKDLGQKLEIVESKCLRRMAFLLLRMKGLYLIKF